MSAFHDEPEYADDSGGVRIDPDAVDAALEKFWHGSPEAFDRLIAEDEGSETSVCAALAGLLEAPPYDFTRPARIGGYVIVREIGRGGMAVVYEAVQDATQQRVALKVTRRWPTTDDSHLRLFRREVATLARLKHPHIAALYDAGHTEEGHHFFAMELVEGVSLAQTLSAAESPDTPTALSGGDDSASRGRARPMPLRRGLALFRDVCGAISHAHQRGVIHCDLKPTNIFVDAQGRPKVLDFGLARLVDAEQGLSTIVGDKNKMMGTVRYMSPEQAEGRSTDIDTRTDVYALGVILYEMTTGRRPYAERSTNLPDLIRHILQTPPRHPGALDPALRGDLETIILKALEKDPARRYPSVEALGDDVDRYLSHLPIRARPAGALYQLKKLVLRHKLPSALIGLLLAVVVGFAVVLGFQASEIRQQRDTAQNEAKRVQRINAFLQELLASADPRRVGPGASVRELLDLASASVETQFADDPRVRAALYDTIGRSYLNLRLPERAEPHLRAALDLTRSRVGEQHADFASALHQMGMLALAQRDTQRADELVERAYQLRLKLLDREHRDVAESLFGLAQLAHVHSRFQDSENLHRQALAIRRAARGAHQEVAESLQALGRWLVESGRYDEAKTMLEEAVNIQRTVLGPDNAYVARTLTELVEIAYHENRFDLWDELARERLRILRKVYPGGNYELGMALLDMGLVHESRGEFAQAESLLREGLVMHEQVFGAGDANMGLPYNELGAFLRDLGRFDEALAYAQKTYQFWGIPVHPPRPGRAYAAQNLAHSLLFSGRPAEAEPLYLDAIDTWRTLFADRQPALTNALSGLGRLRMEAGAFADAACLFEESLALRTSTLGANNIMTALAHIDLGDLALAQRQFDSAELFYRRAIEIYKQHPGRFEYDLARALAGLGLARLEAGDLHEAEICFSDALALDEKMDRDRHPTRGQVLFGRAELRIARDDRPGAEADLREALTIVRARFGETHARTRAIRARLDRLLTAPGTISRAAATP